MMTWKWAFLGFESTWEGRPVQKWFNGLPECHRDEIVDLLLYMQNLTKSLWRRPEFDRLDGAMGISEFIVPDVRDSHGAFYYRLYGYFGPAEHQYTFLHGRNKDVKNDVKGKGIAERRLGEIIRREAGVHRFDF
jgi:hypothetical protein